jgi:hypothetical protein
MVIDCTFNLRNKTMKVSPDSDYVEIINGNKLYDEELFIDFDSNEDDLQFKNVEDQSYIELYNKNELIGYIEVYNDSETEREYICVNNTICYLDDITYLEDDV